MLALQADVENLGGMVVTGTEVVGGQVMSEG
jgi:hypothetical protein